MNIMIVSKNDFSKNKNRCIQYGLSGLKNNIKNMEINYDIIGYLENNKLILLKNRFGSLEGFELNPGLIELFRHK